MKRILVVFFMCSLLWHVACQTPAKSISPNNLNGVPATLFLANGTTITGNISLNNEVLLSKVIEIVPTAGAAQRLHLLDVKGYESKGQYFELKHTSNHFHPRSGFYFMKRLTPEGSQMHLYEHLERKQPGKSLNEQVYKPTYYLQLPGEKMHRVYAANSRKLVPHFHKKMSALLKKCPQLEQKIHNKHPGYFYSRLAASSAQQEEVLLRIINEYNNCAAGQEGR